MLPKALLLLALRMDLFNSPEPNAPDRQETKAEVATSNAGRILVGDSLALLPILPENFFHACVTSPPYWGLRDYGVEGQIGAEMKA